MAKIYNPNPVVSVRPAIQSALATAMDYMLGRRKDQYALLSVEPMDANVTLVGPEETEEIWFYPLKPAQDQAPCVDRVTLTNKVRKSLGVQLGYEIKEGWRVYTQDARPVWVLKMEREIDYMGARFCVII